MGIPRQLAEGKRRNRGKQPALTIELLPAINIHDLRHAIPRNYSTNVYSNSFRYPHIAEIQLRYHDISIIDRSGRVQTFGIKWAKTYFGPNRAIFLCTCGRGAIRLFAVHGTYKCRSCHGAVYASQKRDSKGRKRLSACKLRLELGSLPDLNQPLALKAKWIHRKTYQKLRNQIQTLEGKAKQGCFRKPIDTRIFAYHLVG